MDTSQYTEFRPLMFSIAYRMTGSVSDAEDIVQEAFLRAGKDSTTGVDSPKSYLATITTRLAIDHLRSARVRRESYVGTWLPEPLIASNEPDPADLAETSDSLSMAFLVLLESLAPRSSSKASGSSISRAESRLAVKPREPYDSATSNHASQTRSVPVTTMRKMRIWR